jgi:hypothetical protein
MMMISRAQLAVAKAIRLDAALTRILDRVAELEGDYEDLPDAEQAAHPYRALISLKREFRTLAMWQDRIAELDER